MSVLRERRTRMVRPCTVQMLWYALLEGLCSGGRYNLHPERLDSVSRGLTTHFQRDFFLSSSEWQQTAFGIQRLSTWNVLTNFKTVFKMPVKTMIICKLAHVCATPHCKSNTHNSLTDLTSPIFTAAAAVWLHQLCYMPQVSSGMNDARLSCYTEGSSLETIYLPKLPLATEAGSISACEASHVGPSPQCASTSAVLLWLPIPAEIALVYITKSTLMTASARSPYY